MIYPIRYRSGQYHSGPDHHAGDQGGNAQGRHITSYLRAHYNFKKGFQAIATIWWLDTFHSELKSVTLRMKSKQGFRVDIYN